MDPYNAFVNFVPCETTDSLCSQKLRLVSLLLIYLLFILISLKNNYLIVEVDIYFDEWNIMRGKYYCAQKSIRAWLYDTSGFDFRKATFRLLWPKIRVGLTVWWLTAVSFYLLVVRTKEMQTVFGCQILIMKAEMLDVSPIMNVDLFPIFGL